MPERLLRHLRHALAALLLLPWSLLQASALSLHEDCVARNAAICVSDELPFAQPGACPVGSWTLRPAGNEDCSALAAVEPEQYIEEQAPAAGPLHPALQAATSSPGRIERWFLPALFVGALAILILLIRHLLRLREEGRQPTLDDRSIAIMFASGSIGLYVGFQVTSLVFAKLLRIYDNSDSLLTTLIGGGVALLVFALGVQLAVLAVAALLFWLFGKR
jgi:hypothetical protein